MAITQLRPNGGGSTNWSLVGGASIYAVTSDNSDATYAEASGAAISSADISFGALSALTAGQYIRQVRLEFRENTLAGSGINYAYWINYLFSVLTGAQTPQEGWGYTPATGTFYIGWRPYSWTGFPWTAYDIANLRLHVETVSFNLHVPRLFEIWLDVDVGTNPATAISSPGNGSTVTTTTRPTIVFNYTYTDPLAMKTYQMKVFSAAQYSAPGFDPNTSVPTWSWSPSNETLPVSSGLGKQIGMDLVNGTTYRAYVRVLDTSAKLGYDQNNVLQYYGYSAWVNTQFTIQLDTPVAPAVFSSVTNDLLYGATNCERSTYPWTRYDVGTILDRSTAQFRSGSASLQLKASGAPESFVAAIYPNALPDVLPGKKYTCLAYFRANTTTRSGQTQLQWLDASGNQISIDQGSLVGETNSSWTLASVTATAPVGAASANVILSVYGGGPVYPAGEIHYADDMLAIPTDLQRVALSVELTENMLSEDDASFETTIGSWVAALNSTVVRSTTQFADGVASMRMTATATGDMQAATGFITVGVSTVYTFLASFRASTTGRNAALQANWYDASFAFISTTGLGAAVADNNAGFNQATLTAQSPVNAAYVKMIAQVSAPATSEIHYADKMKLAPGSSTVWSRGYGDTSVPTVTIQRSIDNGATWTSRGIYYQYGDVARGTYFYLDYEALPNTGAIYRAVTSIVDTGLTITGPYSANTALVVVATNEWWLKSTTDPSFNMILDVIGDNFTQVKPEDKATFSALGRNRKVTVADVIKGEEGTLGLDFLLESNYWSFETLRNRQEVLLLQRGWTNEQWYISLGESREMKLFRYTPTYRQVTIPWVEVDVPN